MAWLVEEDNTTNVAFNCLSNIPQAILQSWMIPASSYRKYYERYCDHVDGKILDMNDRRHNVAMSVADMQAVKNLFTRS